MHSASDRVRLCCKPYRHRDPQFKRLQFGLSLDAKQPPSHWWSILKEDFIGYVYLAGILVQEGVLRVYNASGLHFIQALCWEGVIHANTLFLTERW